MTQCYFKKTLIGSVSGASKNSSEGIKMCPHKIYKKYKIINTQNTLNSLYLMRLRKFETYYLS